MRPAAVGVALCDPGTLVVATRLDDQGIAFPVTHVPSQPMGFRRVFRKFAAVGPDRPPCVVQFKELEHSVGQHDKFESVVVRIQARVAVRITIDRASYAPSRSVL